MLRHAMLCYAMLCGSRVPWGEALLSLPPTAESADPTTGQPLLRGLLAKVGIFHGPITRLTPHAVSGQLFPVPVDCQLCALLHAAATLF